MESLDKKLEDILDELPFAEEAIQATKQAFIDDNWVKLPNATMTKEGWIEVSTDKGVRSGGVPLMTKDQWEQQAIKDGWICVPEIYRGKNVVLHANGAESFIRYDGKPVMTGQEWYDRFEKELETTYDLNKYGDIGGTAYGEEDVIDAAKKAAGIE